MNPFLQRCLDLARIPGAAVEPNPRVGAVVVHEGRIIGEGFHEYFGGPHAEVNAIDKVLLKRLLPKSTLYVSLEPCNFHGKTPACSGLILQHRIPKVVIGTLDPNPRVAGQSVAMLREAGVEVEICPEPGPFNALIAHFALNQQLKRPFITLKWAESRDGFIARHDAKGQPVRTAISDPAVSRFVHALRGEHQAILVGSRTVLIDDPALRTQKMWGPDPLPIVLNGDGAVLNGKKIADRAIVLAKAQPIQTLLHQLYTDHKIGSILVEGGTNVLQQFLFAGLWDEMYRNIGAMDLEKGHKAPALSEKHEALKTYQIGNDVVEFYRRA